MCDHGCNQLYFGSIRYVDLSKFNTYFNCFTRLNATDIYLAIQKFQVSTYFRSIWNAVDWLHFALMWIGWNLWLTQNRLSASLSIPETFDILMSTSSNSKARLFLTSPEEEFKFLQFSASLDKMKRNIIQYNVVISMSGKLFSNLTRAISFANFFETVLLFVLRALKVLDFQPRIALVTRTLAIAFTDLIHFFILFGLVTVGYSIAGMLLFG